MRENLSLFLPRRPVRVARQILWLLLACLCLGCGAASADPAHVRRPGESAEAYGRRIIPPGTDLTFTPRETHGFGPAGAILVLYGPTGTTKPLTGWLVHPQGTGADAVWQRAPLPPQKYPSWGLFEVKDVFVAKVADQPLLFVRADHVTNIGPTGAQPFSVTWVYAWKAGTLGARQDLTDQIKTADSRAAIMKRVHGRLMTP